jgi:2-polyprenyl-3-methyl-5-hydroxy-6-metoxy-1,4-benzoquinol methylase
MIHAPMLQSKKLVQSMFARRGYRIVKSEADDLYRPTPADARNAASLLDEILPVVEHNARTGEWPTPEFLERYFDAGRLAMARLLLDRCDAEGVEIDGRRVLDIGCHAGCLLRLMRVRYPEASLFGCDISDVKLAMAERACPDAELFFCALSDLPRSSRYDVLFLMEVLEHMVDPEAVVRRLLDSVSTAGTLILTVPDGRKDQFPAKEYNAEFDSYAGHINFWSPESWSYFLARIAPEWKPRTGSLPTGHLFAALSMRDRAS